MNMTRREWLSTASCVVGGAIGGKLAVAAKRNAPCVKITAVEPLVLHGRSDPAQHPWVWTRVRTDQGVTGYGECYAWMLEKGKLKIPDLVRGIGEQLQGIIVDAVNDIVTVGEEGLQALPNMGDTVAARFLEGLVNIDERLILVLSLERLVEQLPPSAASHPE